MDRKKIELLITICLALILIIALGNSIKAIIEKRLGRGLNVYSQVEMAPSTVSAKAPAQPQNPQPQRPQQQSSQPVDSAKQPALKEGQKEVQKKEAVLKRDPFRRGVNLLSTGQDATKADIANVSLTGIVYDKKNPAESCCIVDGQLLKLGDLILGYILTGIKEDQIILTDENASKDYKINLWEEM